jgi:hypothetical protein
LNGKHTRTALTAGCRPFGKHSSNRSFDRYQFKVHLFHIIIDALQQRIRFGTNALLTNNLSMQTHCADFPKKIVGVMISIFNLKVTNAYPKPDTAAVDTRHSGAQKKIKGVRMS